MLSIYTVQGQHGNKVARQKNGRIPLFLRITYFEIICIYFIKNNLLF